MAPLLSYGDYMLAFLNRLRARLRGFRTYLVSLTIMSLAVVNAADVVPLFPEHVQKWALVFVPVVFAMLRSVTTTPPGGPIVSAEKK